MKKDQDKTKEQLMSELEDMRQRVAVLEAIEVEHKQAEKILSLPDEDYRKLFDLLPIGVVILDIKGVILYCNSAAYNAGGYTEGEFTGKHFSKIASVRVKDIPTFIRVFNSTVRGKIHKPFEVIYQRKDGTTGWTQLHIGLTKVGGKRCILIIQRDTTERKHAGKALRESEERFRVSVETLLDGFAIFSAIRDEAGHIVDFRYDYINEAGCQLNKWIREEQVGHTLLELLPEHKDTGLFDEYVRLVETGQPLVKESKIYEDVFGGDKRIARVFDFRAVKLGDGFAVDWRDITEHKSADEREKQLQQELIAASRLATVGEMAAGIAHEINNPLTGVVGFSDLLMKKDIPEDIRKDVEIIYDGAQRVAGITSRMLAYARQSKPERTTVDINDIIKTTLAMRAYEMESGNIKVTPQLDPDLPTTIADAGQLQQVFLNIILNAETEMINAHGRGTLSIKTERIDNAIRVSFKDDGPGIPNKNLDRIFNPFFTTREVGKGAGLGLSVSHGMVSQQGGKIYAKSRLGRGATFFVELPIITKAKQLKLAEPAIQPGKVAKARILVVDDDLIVQEFLTEILREEGHEVEIIDNGNDALERLESENYDVILLDIKLPGMSGIDLYKHLQKTAKTLARKVLFITGDTMGKDTMAFISKAKPAYITKPFDAELLKKNINRILSQQS